MNIENSKKISQAAPSLFYNSARDEAQEHPFYFECGDGWADLLYDAAAQINNHIKTLPPEVREEIIAYQVKEKFGTLRFYVSYYTPEIDEILKVAVEKSCTTCETCGKEGKIRGSMWLYTACDEHALKEDL